MNVVLRENRHRWSKEANTDFDAETRERLLKTPGFVILGKLKAHGNSYPVGYCENSFSMSVENGRSNFWWIGTATSNFGSKHELTYEKVKASVERHLADLNRNHPDYNFEVWDVHDPEIPVEFDWEHWLWGNARSDRTLSGVRDKYAARNLEFRMKGDDDESL